MLVRIALLFFFITLYGPVNAQGQPQETNLQPLNIVALQIPWLLDEERPGPYNRMVEELLLTYSEKVNLKIVPLRRAMRYFFEGNADCFFVGDYDEAYFQDTNVSQESVIISRPFNTASIRAYTRNEDVPVTAMKDLYDRRIAIDLGVGGSIRVKKLFPNLVNTIDSVNAAQAHAMLIQGRVNSVLMMDYDYELFALRHPEKERLTASTDFQFERVDDAMMCKKSNRTMALLEHVNNRIAHLEKSGQLATLLLPEGMSPRLQTAGRSEGRSEGKPAPN